MIAPGEGFKRGVDRVGVHPIDPAFTGFQGFYFAARTVPAAGDALAMMATKKRSMAPKTVRTTFNTTFNTTKFSWPRHLRPTALRLQWHARFAALPLGLSLQELSRRLDQPYASVAFWAKTMEYPFVLLRRGRKSSIDWDRADWSLRNCDLARQLGVSGERVRQIRLARHQPATLRLTDGGRKFRQFVRTNRRTLDRWSIREMIALSGAEISIGTAHSLLKQVRTKQKT